MKREWQAVVVGALILGAASTLGDLIWAGLGLRHRMVYGLIHGMLLLAVLGMVVARGVGGGLVAGAAGGVAVGLASALLFYAAAPFMGYSAMFVAWMALWILTAALTRRLGPSQSPRKWLWRGGTAAILSGAAFYMISGIWLSSAVGDPNPLYNLACWSFAFACGLAPLLVGRGESSRSQ